jgi:hypothetical protein
MSWDDPCRPLRENDVELMASWIALVATPTVRPGAEVA